MSSRVRLDQLLVDLGLEATRTRARARILVGDVRLDDRVFDKPGTLVPGDSVPVLRERRAFVSRGGTKLSPALEHFAIDPAGLRCADVGASTGGFTDCLLQRGATSVLAIDVGYGQLDTRLRSDPRVDVRERTNIRHFELPDEHPRFDLVVADLSFISLRLVLEKLAMLVKAGGRLVTLVKPQFELGRADVGKGGVVRDPEKRIEAAARVREAGEALGLVCVGEVESEVAGPKGNRERFVYFRKPAP